MSEIEIYEKKSNSAFEMQDWYSAILLLKKLILLDPENIEFTCRIVECYLKLNLFDEAFKVLCGFGFENERIKGLKAEVLRLKGKLKLALEFVDDERKKIILQEIEEYELGDFKGCYKDLVRWFKGNGGKTFYIKLKLFENKFRGISAKTFIDQGTKIISVPKDLILFPDLCKSILPSNIKYNFKSYHSIFALFLATELKNTSSPWLPYLNSLPTNLENFPIFFNSFHLNLLQNSSLLQMIQIQRQEIEEDFQLISHLNLCSFEEFLKAKLTVSSRLHSIKSDKDESGLVPLADMFNHKAGSTTGWFFDFDSQSFCIQTNQVYEKGQEICIDYGDKSNVRLMIGYGFAVEDNEFDEVFMDFGTKGLEGIVEIVEVVKDRGSRFRVNRKCGSKEFREVLGFLRIRFCLDKGVVRRDLEKFLRFGNVDALDKENEVLVLEYLRKKCQKRLNCFISIPHPETSIDFNTKNCLLVIDGEKKVLSWVIDFCTYILNLIQTNSPHPESSPYQAYLNSLINSNII